MPKLLDLLTEAVGHLRTIAASSGSSDSPVTRHPRYDPILTGPEAAKYCGVHTKTLARDTMAGDLVAVRRSEGGTLRYRLSDLNTYLDKQRTARDRRRQPARLEDRDWAQ